MSAVGVFFPGEASLDLARSRAGGVCSCPGVGRRRAVFPQVLMHTLEGSRQAPNLPALYTPALRVPEHRKKGLSFITDSGTPWVFLGNIADRQKLLLHCPLEFLHRAHRFY